MNNSFLIINIKMLLIYYEKSINDISTASTRKYETESNKIDRIMI